MTEAKRMMNKRGSFFHDHMIELIIIIVILIVLLIGLSLTNKNIGATFGKIVDFFRFGMG
jgi:hypothetical protein